VSQVDSDVLPPPSRGRVRERGHPPIETATIVTLGCKLNQAESNHFQIELAKAGVRLVPFGEPADLSIVNTCTVTHVADQQARQTLRRARRFSPNGYVVAVGCYAQVAPAEVRAVEGVDLVVESGKDQLLERLESEGLALGNLSPDHLVPLPATRVRQFVKVQDGCDDYCTYCIVPFARGHSLSRSADAVVAEVKELIERGCREVVLTGVQIGAYGRDRYAMKGQDLPAPGAPLAVLVRRLLLETDIPRIRISSIQPQDWPDDFLELFEDPRLCQHLHLPLQAGCDATLRRMSRRYTKSDFARLVARMRSAMPDVAITADIIAGFPGESEGDHGESLAFVREIQFADAHVFRYSPRHGTAASRMREQVAPEAKKRRSEELRLATDRSAWAFRARFVGARRSVLWEEALPREEDGPRRWTGLTDNYLRAECEAREELLGQIESVRLSQLDEAIFKIDRSKVSNPPTAVRRTSER